MLDNTELQAVKTLLDEGIKVPVTAPLFFRLFGKRKVNVVIKQPYLGTLYRISKIRLAAGISTQLLENESADYLYLNYGKPMCRIAANAMLNNYWLNILLNRIVSVWLLDKLTPIYLQTILKYVKALSAKEAFTNTIGLVDEMIMTKPNLSPETQGS